MTISLINCWYQVNSWKNLWKLWNGPICRNKSGSFPLLNVAGYWQSSNTETCVKKLSQILANNIDNRGREIGLRIYVRYCSLAIKRSSLIVLKVFKKFISIAPPYPFWSRIFFHLSINDSNACPVLKPFLYQHIKRDKNWST